MRRFPPHVSHRLFSARTVAVRCGLFGLWCGLDVAAVASLEHLFKPPNIRGSACPNLNKEVLASHHSGSVRAQR